MYCPNCGKYILPETTTCLHCGYSSVRMQENARKAKFNKRIKGAVCAVLILVLVIGCGIWFQKTGARVSERVISTAFCTRNGKSADVVYDFYKQDEENPQNGSVREVTVAKEMDDTQSQECGYSIVRTGLKRFCITIEDDANTQLIVKIDAAGNIDTIEGRKTGEELQAVQPYDRENYIAGHYRSETEKIVKATGFLSSY